MDVKWPPSALGDVCEIIAGQSPPGSTYRKHPEGLPFFQGKADFGHLHPIAKAWCVEPKKVALPDDILISVRAPVGPTNIADTKCCIGRGLAAIRCGANADRDFILYAIRLLVGKLIEKASGSTFDAINIGDLAALEIPLPRLPEQKHIVAVLNEQMATVEKARRHAQDRKEAASALPVSFLKEAFGSGQCEYWSVQRLADVAGLLTSRSIATHGDAEVRAITTACLSESGFMPGGVKDARMQSEHVEECLVQPGEILVARSNTEELVGRSSMFQGDPPGVVASDLTIRVWPDGQRIQPLFLSYYLSYLFQKGYWREKAGGASGSMKKITRGQLRDLEVPVPDQAKQASIVEKLDKTIPMARGILETANEELAAIAAVPASLLRQAFSGSL